MDTALKEISKSVGPPAKNKKINKKLFSGEADFLERVKQNQQKVTEKRERLDKKLYDNMFVPQIHRANKVEA